MEIKLAAWGWNPPKYELLSDNSFKIYFNPKEETETITYTDLDTNEETTKDITVYKVNYIEETNPELLQAIKNDNKVLISQLLLKERINAYDQSSNVNSFSISGSSIWLDKDTRVGLMNSITIEKDSGSENTTLWFNNVNYTLPCDTAIAMLKQLELYALKCYNVTAEHLKAVSNLQTIEELDNYDYKSGYPDKLVF